MKSKWIENGFLTKKNQPSNVMYSHSCILQNDRFNLNFCVWIRSKFKSNERKEEKNQFQRNNSINLSLPIRVWIQIIRPYILFDIFVRCGFFLSSLSLSRSNRFQLLYLSIAHAHPHTIHSNLLTNRSYNYMPHSPKSNVWCVLFVVVVVVVRSFGERLSVSQRAKIHNVNMNEQVRLMMSTQNYILHSIHTHTERHSKYTQRFRSSLHALLHTHKIFTSFKF